MISLSISRECERVLRKTIGKLETNWATAEWAVFRVNGQSLLVINGTLREDADKNRSHEQTFLNETGIPAEMLRGIAPTIDWGGRKAICRITELEQALAPIARGLITPADQPAIIFARIAESAAT